MKGSGNQPTFQQHLENHAILLSTARSMLGTPVVPRENVNSYLMQATGVGTRQSVLRNLEAWEDLRLIAPGWNTKAKVKTVKLLPRPEGMGGELAKILDQLTSAPA